MDPEQQSVRLLGDPAPGCPHSLLRGASHPLTSPWHCPHHTDTGGAPDWEHPGQGLTFYLLQAGLGPEPRTWCDNGRFTAGRRCWTGASRWEGGGVQPGPIAPSGIEDVKMKRSGRQTPIGTKRSWEQRGRKTDQTEESSMGSCRSPFQWSCEGLLLGPEQTVKVAGVTPWIHHRRVKSAYHADPEDAEWTTQKDPTDPCETKIISKKKKR
nr:uncharacterized protein LOC110124932 isoform X2 [Odocoileus virginianus texanus]